MNKMKAMKIAVPACICAVVLIILAAVLMNGKDSKTWKDYYVLGMQYLKEENYEEAIVAFTSAIELDSRQAVVYIGRGDAYAGLAEREEKQGDLEEAKELYENAADDYEQAVELGEKEEAADKLKRIQAAIDRLKYSYEMSLENRRMAIVEAYNAVMAQLSTIQVKAEAAALYNAQMRITEQDFVNGKIDITALSLERSRRSQAISDYEQSKVSLYNAITMLEMMTNIAIIRR